MFPQIDQLIRNNNILSHENEGIRICSVLSQTEGFRLAKDILYAVSNNNTVLYLSGGKTPKELYAKLAEEKKLLAGAVGLVDERYGAPMHETSNELMLKQTGFLDYVHAQHIRFYGMLEANKTREAAAASYDQTFRSINAMYQKSIATLGIGLDGHTAGIAGNRTDFKNPMFEEKDLLVSSFNDTSGMFKERISMTFLGLSMIDLLLVLVFGDEKKEALEKMFETGKEEEIPARFLKRADIAPKTILITNQNI